MKEALENCAGTYEMMKEICAALGDADRGRTAPMSALLSNVQSRHAGRSAEQTLQVPALWVAMQRLLVCLLQIVRFGMIRGWHHVPPSPCTCKLCLLQSWPVEQPQYPHICVTGCCRHLTLEGINFALQPLMGVVCSAAGSAQRGEHAAQGTNTAAGGQHASAYGVRRLCSWLSCAVSATPHHCVLILFRESDSAKPLLQVPDVWCVCRADNTRSALPSVCPTSD